MKHLIVIQTILLLLLLHLMPSPAPHAAEQTVVVSTSKQSAGPAAYRGLQAFLGAPLSLPMQQLWKGGGGTSIVTAQDGSVIAFQSMASNKIRRSPDGGVTWGTDIEIGPDATYANAIVDENNGDILYVNPAKQWLWRSRDHGLTWTRETI